VEPNINLKRWKKILNEYDFEIKNIKGKQNNKQTLFPDRHIEPQTL